MQHREQLEDKEFDSDEDEDDSDYEPSEDSEEVSDEEDEDEEQKKEFDVEAFNRSKKLWDQCTSKTVIPKTNLDSDSQDAQPASIGSSASRAIASKFDESNEIPLKVKIQADPIASSVSGSNLKPMPAKPRGISASLGKIGEKRKVSILESSRLQWDTFKEETGIQDELEAHNRSKNSYLDKQDFLARTDYKEYMIMRDKSLSSRK